MVRRAQPEREHKAKIDGRTPLSPTRANECGPNQREAVSRHEQAGLHGPQRVHARLGPAARAMRWSELGVEATVPEEMNWWLCWHPCVRCERPSHAPTGDAMLSPSATLPPHRPNHALSYFSDSPMMKSCALAICAYGAFPQGAIARCQSECSGTTRTARMREVHEKCAPTRNRNSAGHKARQSPAEAADEDITSEAAAQSVVLCVCYSLLCGVALLRWMGLRSAGRRARAAAAAICDSEATEQRAPARLV